MSSPPPLGAEVYLGIAGAATVAVAAGLFWRSTRSKKVDPVLPVAEEPLKPEQAEPASHVQSAAGTSLSAQDVESSRKTLKLLGLERDAMSSVIVKFFEAEDEGEISKEDRVKLSRDYEEKMKSLSDRARQMELVIGLYELEKIREEIVKRFDAKLNETNAKIKELRGELKIEMPVGEEKKILKEKKPIAEGENEEKEGESEEKPRQRRQRVSEIDEKIEKLRQEVLKELEELEKLEIEV